MKRKVGRIVIVAAVILVAAQAVVIARLLGSHTMVAGVNVNCGQCHGEITGEQALSDPVIHQTMNCTSCHTGSTHTTVLPANIAEMCDTCHGGVVADHAGGGHSGVLCYQCHSAAAGL